RGVAGTTEYVRERRAFANALIDFQNTPFKLAECKTEAHIARVFLNDCVARFIAGQLDAFTAAMAKYWLTDCECRIVDQCLQFHGGYGFMAGYPLGRLVTRNPLP